MGLLKLLRFYLFIYCFTVKWLATHEPRKPSGPHPALNLQPSDLRFWTTVNSSAAITNASNSHWHKLEHTSQHLWNGMGLVKVPLAVIEFRHQEILSTFYIYIIETIHLHHLRRMISTKVIVVLGKYNNASNPCLPSHVYHSLILFKTFWWTPVTHLMHIRSNNNL